MVVFTEPIELLYTGLSQKIGVPKDVSQVSKASTFDEKKIQ